MAAACRVSSVRSVVRFGGRHGSGAEARGGEQVGTGGLAGIGGEGDEGLARLPRGQRRAGPFPVRGDVHALPGGVGGDRGGAEVGRGGQLRQHRDEPDAEPVAFGFRRGVRGDEPDRGLRPGVAAGQRRAPEGGPAGHRDDRAARRERGEQRLAQPVERLLDVGVPVAAERLPRVVLQRTRQRGGAGVEHENAGPVGVDELPGHGGVGRVGAHRGEGLAEFGAQFFQRGAVAGDPDDRGAGPVERGGDSPAEPPAGPGDQRGRALNVIAWHNDSPGVLRVPAAGRLAAY